MAKKSELDRAIEALNKDRTALFAQADALLVVIKRLEEQQGAKQKRKPKAARSLVIDQRAAG
jgi:hypothetical protein